jgi:hypothetical protein
MTRSTASSAGTSDRGMTVRAPADDRGMKIELIGMAFPFSRR